MKSEARVSHFLVYEDIDNQQVLAVLLCTLLSSSGASETLSNWGVLWRFISEVLVFICGPLYARYCALLRIILCNLNRNLWKVLLQGPFYLYKNRGFRTELVSWSTRPWYRCIWPQKLYFYQPCYTQKSWQIHAFALCLCSRFCKNVNILIWPH